jgi:hypothetical protein
VASSSGSPSPYSFLRRPFFLLAEVKDEDDDAAAAAVVVMRGMDDPPACEPDEILVEVVAEALALALEWCGCCREESWREWPFLVLELRRVCRRMSVIKRGADSWLWNVRRGNEVIWNWKTGGCLPSRVHERVACQVAAVASPADYTLTFRIQIITIKDD